MSRDNDPLEASSAYDGGFISHGQLVCRCFVAFPLAGVPEERGSSEEVDEDHEPGQVETNVITVNKKRKSV